MDGDVKDRELTSWRTAASPGRQYGLIIFAPLGNNNRPVYMDFRRSLDVAAKLV